MRTAFCSGVKRSVEEDVVGWSSCARDMRFEKRSWAPWGVTLGFMAVGPSSKFSM